MNRSEQYNVRIVVDNERSLYTPFSPEAEFSDTVKEYFRSRATTEDTGRSVRLTVISRETLDEERFRDAVSNWIRAEKALFRIKEKETIRTLAGLLIFGSIFIILSIALQNKYDVLKYSLLPILGSLSLSRAAGILILDIPTVRTQRKMISEMEKKNVITFEYVHEENTPPDKELV